MTDELESEELRALQLRQEYGWLYDRLTEILFEYDLAKLAAVGVPLDEYSVEVDRILPFMKEIESPTRLSQKLYEVFVQMFNEKMILPQMDSKSHRALLVRNERCHSRPRVAISIGAQIFGILSIISLTIPDRSLLLASLRTFRGKSWPRPFPKPRTSGTILRFSLMRSDATVCQKLWRKNSLVRIIAKTSTA